MIMLEPSLSTATPSKFFLSINKFDGCVMIGVAVNSLLVKKSYKYKTSGSECKDSGVHGMLFSGKLHSPAGVAKEEGIAFDDGDRVVVEWKPTVPAVCYSKVGSDKSVQQSFDKEHLSMGMLCFFVGVRRADVSLVV